MGNNPRIIAGSGRSGTTWIQDVLAEVNQLRTVFEPLHPQAVTKALPFANRYIATGDEAAGLEDLLNQVFFGEFHSIWTDYRIRPRLLKPTLQRFSSPGNAYALFTEWRVAIERFIRFRQKINLPSVIVKVIRANLMLGWLREKYDARIVFVTRHPGAVVESKLRIGGTTWDPAPVLDHYRTPGVLGEHENRYAALLAEDLGPAESHTLIWCIENQLPMEQAKEQGYLLVFYENLAKHGEREWKRIIDALGLKVSPYGSQIVERPSQQSAPKRSKQKRGGGKLWHDRIATTELDAIDSILRATGVEAYSAYDPLPLSKKIVEELK